MLALCRARSFHRAFRMEERKSSLRCKRFSCRRQRYVLSTLGPAE
jgi:hypothetical protein